MADKTATCDICKEERPNNRIIVFEMQYMTVGGVYTHFKVAYCGDNQTCSISARSIIAQEFQNIERIQTQ